MKSFLEQAHSAWLDHIKQDTWGMTGFELYCWLRTNVHGEVTINKVNQGKNLITNVGLRQMMRALRSPAIISNSRATLNFELKRFGVSNDAYPVQPTDTILSGSPYYRTIEQIDVIDKNLICTCFVMKEEAPFTWGTAGLLLSDGTLFAAKNIVEPKTSEYSLTLTWTISFGGGS